MPLAKIQQRIDPKLKKEAEQILKAQGIKPSQAIVMFYKEITRQRSFPFFPSHVPKQKLVKAFEEADKGIGLTTYKNAEEMFAALEKL